MITLADSFDAMTSDRSYRRKLSYADALLEVERCAGTHFDPYLAHAFVKCWREKISHIETNYLLEVASSLDK
jgi:HD-GYP domain-containing protein (c-di-GMP phosphodiesterase class II)